MRGLAVGGAARHVSPILVNGVSLVRTDLGGKQGFYLNEGLPLVWFGCIGVECEGMGGGVEVSPK